MERNKKRLTLPLEGHEAGAFSPCFSHAQTSPMTVLSASMVGLSCVGSTPKRRLSLSSIGESPPPLPSSTHPLSRQSSQSSGCSVGTPSPCDSPFITEQFQPIQPHSEETNSRQGSRFKRFNSMPLRLQAQDSPSFSAIVRPRLKRQERLEESSQDERENADDLEQLWMKPTLEEADDDRGETSDKTKIDLGPAAIDLPSDNADACSEQGFKFAIPKPLSARASSTTSSTTISSTLCHESRPTSAPALLLDGIQSLTSNEDDDVELRHDRLTSSNDDDEDDGFCDIFDSDPSENSTSGFSEGLAGLIRGPLITSSKAVTPPSKFPSVFQNSQQESGLLRETDCNAIRTTPAGAPRCRKGIFKVPSQPVLARRNSAILKRAERPRDMPSPVQNKRPRSSSVASPQIASQESNKVYQPVRKPFGRSLSMMSPNDPHFKKIDQALSVDGAQMDLIGDRTKSCCLPTVQGKQKDLKNISPETMCRILRSEFSDQIGECYIIDCRYPYEYEGGHIQDAKNIYQKDKLQELFLDNPMAPLPGNKRRVIIFHCEFSSQRGPDMLRFLRNKDRAANLENYPSLYYPELYLLNEGYKVFFEQCKEFCDPPSYTPMNHDNHTQDLRHFRAKSKSWTGERSRLRGRSQSLF